MPDHTSPPIRWQSYGRSYGKIRDLIGEVQTALILDGEASILTAEGTMVLRFDGSRITAELVGIGPVERTAGQAIVGGWIDELIASEDQ